MKQSQRITQLTNNPSDDNPNHKKQPRASLAGTGARNPSSLKTIVPEGVIAFLELKAGDKLDWRMDIVNNERVASVKKMISDEEATAIALKYAKPKKTT